MNRFLLQAVNDEDHLAPAREVFGLGELQAATISTAFMTASGLSLLQDALEPIAERTRIFVGIRNGVTTVQSIQKALEIGCETYMVDTGSRQRIFHPKMYYSRSAVRAKLLLGSANLTMGGLRTNIEASVLQELDTTVDAAFLADLDNKLDAMVADYPDHVIRAVDEAQLADLQRAGRLRDERQVRPPEPAGSSSERALDSIPKMKLRTKPVGVPRPAAPPTPTIAPATPVARERMEQVWESKALKRRHLNIPAGDKSNPTGSMTLGRGNWPDIDQRYYHRHEVFAALDWIRDTQRRTAHYERASVTMRIVIRNVDFGEQVLGLRHNTDETMNVYRAGNSPTELVWHDAKALVAKEDLLKRVLRLYRDTNDHTRFLLEID
ncbi:phospholipase D family protein [Ruegeria arenilitoris]|uniref:phospholipase D family protein n=1 Tax=Ruegeria arenilitoris TaxID=1173585 RepID=UPI001479F589|nr:phospholipase D family protein [Ruegeria arenilitoris]